MARVLVTGGAGFIGSHLCDALVERGDDVVCVDNLVGTSGEIDNIAHLLCHDNFEFIEADVLDRVDLKGVDTVYHQAASKAAVCLDDPELDLDVNALGTLRLLMDAKRAGVRKFVHASTGSVYGQTRERLTEGTARYPVSFYGISKAAGESYCALFARHGMSVTVLRYFHVIGPRQSSIGVVPTFAERGLQNLPLIIYGNGQQTRSFTSVHDVVKANLWAAETDEPSVYVNVASGISVTIQELAEFVNAETHSTAGIEYQPRRVGDISRFDVDNSLITSHGITFDTDWKFMVREVLAWEVQR